MVWRQVLSETILRGTELKEGYVRFTDGFWGQGHLSLHESGCEKGLNDPLQGVLGVWEVLVFLFPFNDFVDISVQPVISNDRNTNRRP